MQIDSTWLNPDYLESKTGAALLNSWLHANFPEKQTNCWRENSLSIATS